jgi:ribosomal protein L37E
MKKCEFCGNDAYDERKDKCDSCSRNGRGERKIKFDQEKHHIVGMGYSANIRCKTCNKYIDRCVCDLKEK